MDRKLDPRLDLSFERIIDLPVELVWAAWTKPEHLVHWFTPKPWKTVGCEIELKVGGRFHTVMQSPEGQTFPNEGCYLELVENQKLTWTTSLRSGFRPAPASSGDMHFAVTATVEMEPHAKGTKYTAKVLHADEASRQRHEKMGFEHGWGLALDQLVAHMKKQA